MKSPKIGICITSLGASPTQLRQLDALLKTTPELGNVKVYGDIRANDIFGSRSVEDRLSSLERASNEADIVIAWNGGFNAIELLEGLSSLRLNPAAIFVGYSDNTLLVNALPVMGKMNSWMGPMVKDWIERPDLMSWWWRNLQALCQADYAQVSQTCEQLGYTIYREGEMVGKVWGGNNYTFDLLQGTPFCPSFAEPYILLLEGEDFVTAKDRIWQDFIRNLDSIMLLPGARDNITGLIIGKFPESYLLDTAEVEASFKKRSYLQNIPIVYDFPRGYRSKSLYLPIGEQLSIKLSSNMIQIGKL